VHRVDTKYCPAYKQVGMESLLQEREKQVAELSIELERMRVRISF